MNDIQLMFNIALTDLMETSFVTWSRGQTRKRCKTKKPHPYNIIIYGCVFFVRYTKFIQGGPPCYEARRAALGAPRGAGLSFLLALPTCVAQVGIARLAVRRVSDF